LHFGHTRGGGCPCSLGSHWCEHRSQTQAQTVIFTRPIPPSMYLGLRYVKYFRQRYG
jgi:hypothetical protein